MLFIMKNMVFLVLWTFLIVVTIPNADGHPEPPDHLAFQIESSLCGKRLIHLVRVRSYLANENLPLFTTSNAVGPKYIELDKTIMKEVGEFAMYHDYETRSAFVYFRKTGRLNGIVNLMFHVEGVHINDLDKVQKVSSTNSKYLKWLFSSKSFKKSRRLRSTNKTNGTNVAKIRTRREDSEDIPIVYPELLITISYDMFKALGKNYRKAISHVLTVYNGVDLLYKTVQTVDIRINIAAIVFEGTKDFWSFIPRKNVGRKVEIDHETINPALSNYFKTRENYFPRDSYDYIAYNTRLLITSALPNSHSHGISISHAPSAVFPFDNENRYGRLNMAVTDFEGYESYSTIAHELAHIFNAKHDEEQPEYDTSPSCSGSRRSSLMASDCSELSLDWSDYTEMEFGDFFSSPFSCNLRNYPLSLLPFPRKPRRMLLGTEQCQCYGFAGFTTPVYYSPDWCAEPLHCLDANNEVQNNLPLPFDGTPCGNYKVCWSKSCVAIEAGSLI